MIGNASTMRQRSLTSSQWSIYFLVPQTPHNPTSPALIYLLSLLSCCPESVNARLGRFYMMGNVSSLYGKPARLGNLGTGYHLPS
jgi:hypothetical protein